MPIHHATVKRAQALGIVLTSDGDEEFPTVTAHNPEKGVSVSLTLEDEEGSETDLAKDALVACQNIVDFHAENEAIKIEQEDGDYVASHREDGEEIARDPDLDDLFVSIREALEGEESPEGEDGEEDEDEPSGSVVPDKYKKLYAAEGHAGHCGDWLANLLNSLCQVQDGKKVITDLDRLSSIASVNDVEPARYGKLGVATNGWQGRYRMTVRNMLAPRVALKGFLFVPEGLGRDADAEEQAPEAWRAKHMPKTKAPKEVAKEPGAGKASAKTRAKKAKPDTGEAGLAAANAAIKASNAKRAKAA